MTPQCPRANTKKTTATLPTAPRSPTRRPSETVIRPIRAIEARTPRENTSDSLRARPVEASSCVEMKPTTSGTLARWQGLKTMLTTPQAKAASRAQPSDSLRPLLRLVRTCSSTALLRRDLLEPLLDEQRLDLLLRVEAGVPMELDALLVEEHLRGDVLDAVLLCG